MITGDSEVVRSKPKGDDRAEVARALISAFTITLFVVIVLFAVTMVGCGEQNPQPPAINATLRPPPPKIQPTPKPAEKVVRASFYGPGFAGHQTASGERFNPNAMTAASKTLPIGSVVRVTNPETGRSVTVRINDRGPYVKGRSLDLSKGAARKIGLSGVAKVKIRPLKMHSEVAAGSTEKAPASDLAKANVTASSPTSSGAPSATALAPGNTAPGSSSATAAAAAASTSPPTAAIEPVATSANAVPSE